MAHTELWEQLSHLDGNIIKDKAKCQYMSNPGRYILRLLNVEYTINPAERQIFSFQPGGKKISAGFIEQLCLLAYLINAKELPLANRLVKAESLPGGAFFFRGLHSLPTQKLEQAFGDNPTLLYHAAEHLNGKKLDFGDVSVELPILPRIPLTFIVWAGDDEFDARASILFDQTASEQLPLDALGAAVNLAVNIIIGSVNASD